MVGLIDCGGGMRGVYTSGVYDYFWDIGLNPEYCIGVSAGAANLISFLAGHRDRTLRFYNTYPFRKEYMSLRSYFKTGSYLNLDYIYSALSNSDGEDPLNFPRFMQNPCRYYAVASDARTGLPHYFSREDFTQNHYEVLKASCALPVACLPQQAGDGLYFDGGLSAPIPYEKAFADGCDQVIVLITRPKDEVKQKQKNLRLMRPFLRKYPKIFHLLETCHEVYNRQMRELKELEKEGSALIVAPADTCGMTTLTKDKAAMHRLYKNGYNDGKKAAEFIKGTH